MISKQLVIVMTDRCNARCEICGFSCGPERKNVINEHLLLDIIDQTPSIPGLDTIGFSGGEPTLFPDLLIKAAERARKKQLRVTLMTNGQWGKWPTARLIKFFQAFKPDAIHFSTDTFHRHFINDKTLGRAVAFTYAMGVQAHISANSMRVGLSAQELWNQMGTYKHLYPYCTYSALRYGRATQFRRGDFSEMRFAEKCRCSTGSRFSIVWNGIAKPCCKYEVFYSCLALGNAHDTPLSEMMINPVMELVQLLEKEGFSSLLEAAKKVDPTLPVDNFSYGCGVCNELFRNPSFTRKYAPLIQPDATRKLVLECLEYMEENTHFSGDQWIETDAKRSVTLKRGEEIETRKSSSAVSI